MHLLHIYFLCKVTYSPHMQMQVNMAQNNLFALVFTNFLIYVKMPQIRWKIG